MSKRRPTIASQLARQPRKQGNVASIGDASPLRSSIVRRTDETSGLPTLHAAFPTLAGVVEFDLSFMLAFSGLQEPFAEGFRLWGAGVKTSSRRNALTSLQRNFFEFLKESDLRSIELGEIDRPLIFSFVSWLNRRTTASNALLAAGTKKEALGTVRNLVHALARTTEWRSVARRVDREIPDNVWPGSHHQATPKSQLQLDHMRAIVRAAENEIQQIRTRLDQLPILLRIGEKEISVGRTRGSLPSFLYLMHQRYPTLIPSQSDLTREDRSLGNEMQAFHGQRGITQYFYAGSRDLVPFVILILAATAFNPETALTLDWANVRPEERFNTPVVTFVGSKSRADEDQVVLDGDSGGFGMAVILETLDRITKRLRPHLSHPGDRGRLFVFAQERGAVAPKAYRHNPSDLAVSDSSLRHSRLRFIEENELEPFTFDQFRTTLLDAAHRWTGDLRVVTSLGRQKSAHTGWQSYNSARARAGYQERIGETIVLRERWFGSDGKIDPRGSRLTSVMDRGAATPGFLCADPYDSPLPGQVSGRLCSAYGECPACPLAGANVGDNAHVAYYLALRACIFESQGRIAPPAWIARWAPIVEALDDLIQLVPASALSEAAKLQVTLPAVG